VSTVHAAIVEAKDQVNLVPLVTGRVEKLNVDIGTEVRQGQIIAELGHGTLEAQLQQAQAVLRNAQARLAAVMGTPGIEETEVSTPLSVAHARLKQLLNPSISDLQAAESAVASAQAKLDSARTKLDKLINPSTSEVQVSESAVATAQAKLDSARTKLNKLLNPSAADLAAAQAAVADAQNKLSTAQADVNEAIAKELSKAFTPTSARWQMVLQARINLEANTATLQNLQPAFSWVLDPVDIAGAQQIVTTNQKVISNLLEEINSISLISQDIRTAMWAESAARATLDNARAKLRELQNPNQNTIALEQYNISEAQASLDSARAKLKELHSPSQNTIALEQYNVNEAQASLSTAVARLNSLKNPEPAAVAAARAAVTAAEQEVSSNQALVDQAHAQVNLVKQQLAETQVIAPFDGFVTRRWLSLGAIASPQTPVVTMVGKDAVVSFRVEETAVSSLQRGQQVTFTTPALAGQRFELRVDQLAPTGDEKAHTFLVQMRPVATTPGLKPGMSGQIVIITRRENVVLVPKEGVLQQSGHPTLFVVQDGKAHLRRVNGGLIDDKNIEIQDGVRPGEQVVVSGQNLLKDEDQVTIERPTERRRPQG
jgi:RND family efflux transporter MFP subunit